MREHQALHFAPRAGYLRPPEDYTTLNPYVKSRPISNPDEGDSSRRQPKTYELIYFFSKNNTRDTRERYSRRTTSAKDKTAV